MQKNKIISCILLDHSGIKLKPRETTETMSILYDGMTLTWMIIKEIRESF